MHGVWKLRTRQRYLGFCFVTARENSILEESDAFGRFELLSRLPHKCTTDKNAPGQKDGIHFFFSVLSGCTAHVPDHKRKCCNGNNDLIPRPLEVHLPNPQVDCASGGQTIHTYAHLRVAYQDWGRTPESPEGHTQTRAEHATSTQKQTGRIHGQDLCAVSSLGSTEISRWRWKYAKIQRKKRKRFHIFPVSMDVFAAQGLFSMLISIAPYTWHRGGRPHHQRNTYIHC